jgi:hypothetical protein
MTISSRRGISARVTDLSSGHPPRELRPTGFAPWDLSLGGLAPGIARVLGPRSFEYALGVVAADPQSVDETVVIGLGKPEDVLACIAGRLGLNDLKKLPTTDCATLIHSIRAYGWRYMLIDRADLLRINYEYAVELDRACFDSRTTLFACASYDSSHAARIAASPWSYAVQSIRLVPEVPNHSNGIFEVRVIDNPLATSIASNSAVRVMIPALGPITLADPDEGVEPLILEMR